MKLGLILIFSLAAYANADWPQWMGPQRNGVAAPMKLAATWPASGPIKLWKTQVGQGFSGPVVRDGKLVLFHRVKDRETIACFNAVDGKNVWETDYPTRYVDSFGFDEGPRATPTIADNRVYTFGAQGLLQCTDFTSGKRLWQVDTRQSYKSQKGFFGMACSPLVEGDAVMVNIGGDNGAGIVAFHKATGKELWKATDTGTSYASPVSATIQDKRYAFFFNRDGLAAVDPVNGRVYFEFPWRPSINASVNAATPLVVGDQVFISTSYGRGAILLKFKESGPEEIWSGDRAISSHYSSSVHHDGYLYGFDGRQERGGILRCVVWKTGEVKWSKRGLGSGWVILSGDQLLVLTERGQLLLAPATPAGFKPTAQAQVLGFDTRAVPALAQGRLHARDKNQLITLDLSGN